MRSGLSSQHTQKAADTKTPLNAKQGLRRSLDLVTNQLLVDDNPALHIPFSFAQLALSAPQLSCQLGCLNLKPAECKVLS